MAKEKTKAAYEVLEYLVNMGGAAKRDIYTAMGPGNSSAVTAALKKLEEMSFTRLRTSGKAEYIAPGSRGISFLEKQDPHYRENRDLYRPCRASRIADSTGTREAVSLCMNASRIMMRISGNCGPLRAYRKDKPSPGMLFRAMRSLEAADAGPSEKGYMQHLEPDELADILRGGVFYTSAEMKRCFADSEVHLDGGERTVNRGSEAMNGSRITGFLFDLVGFWVFYRSSGSIPRCRYDVESRMINAVLEAGASRFPPYAERAGGSDKVRPAAIVISRSPAIIPALITGYAHGRVKNPDGPSGEDGAPQNRKYYERQFFNPCCGLYREVYAVPYFASWAPDLCYILGNDAASMKEEGERWCRRFLGIRIPLPRTMRLGDFACAHDDSSGCDIIYSPVVDIALYRSTLREFIRSSDYHYPRFAIVTRKRYCDPLARAVSRKTVRMYDAMSGRQLKYRSYDVYGYPADGKDPYSAASRKWWDSDRSPEKLSSCRATLPREAAEELKEAAAELGCSAVRLAGHIVSVCLDGEEWKERFGSPADKEVPYADRLLRQDERSGRNRRASSALRTFLRKEGSPDDVV